MATLRYILRTDKPAQDGSTAISLIYAHDKKEIRLSVGRSILPTHWNPKALDNWVQKSYGENYIDFNAYLRKRKNIAQGCVDRFYNQNDRHPSTIELKDLYLAATGSKQAPDKSFFGLFDQFVNFQANGRGLKNVAPNTIKSYGKVPKRLKEYAAHHRIEFTFQSLNVGFYDAFTKYCIEEHRNCPNAIGGYIKIIKAFLKWCRIHRGVDEVSAVAIAQLYVTKEDNFFIWFTKEELDFLISIDLSQRPLLDLARDTWCLQACFGCRISDLAKLLGESLVWEGGKYFLKMKTKKNQKLVQVPVSSRAVKILDKHKGVAPKDWVMQDVLVNRYIKLVCKAAGFHERVEITKGVGNYRRSEIKQRWELVTTHTAVRLFINTMKAEGVEDHILAAMTGKSIKTLQTYKHGDTSGIEEAMRKWDRPAPTSHEPKGSGQ